MTPANQATPHHWKMAILFLTNSIAFLYLNPLPRLADQAADHRQIAAPNPKPAPLQRIKLDAVDTGIYRHNAAYNDCNNRLPRQNAKRQEPLGVSLQPNLNMGLGIGNDKAFCQAVMAH